MPATVPRYIEAALRKQPATWRYFQGLAPSHRRRYLGWIESAKREETKARRLQEAIRLPAGGKLLAGRPCHFFKLPHYRNKGDKVKLVLPEVLVKRGKNW